MARDMTQGNITKHLLLYAGPLIIGDLFQQLYHTVDSVVVGQFRGKEALAAIGAAGPVMNILIFMIAGISMGASILMAEYYGAKKYEDLKEEMATSIGAGLLLTLVLSLLFYAGSGLFIRLTQTPEEISHMAAGYLRIISAGLIFTFFYNLTLCADTDNNHQCCSRYHLRQEPGFGSVRGCLGNRDCTGRFLAGADSLYLHKGTRPAAEAL